MLEGTFSLDELNPQNGDHQIMCFQNLWKMQFYITLDWFAQSLYKQVKCIRDWHHSIDPVLKILFFYWCMALAGKSPSVGNTDFCTVDRAQTGPLNVDELVTTIPGRFFPIQIYCFSRGKLEPTSMVIFPGVVSWERCIRAIPLLRMWHFLDFERLSFIHETKKLDLNILYQCVLTCSWHNQKTLQLPVLNYFNLQNFKNVRCGRDARAVTSATHVFELFKEKIVE